MAACRNAAVKNASYQKRGDLDLSRLPPVYVLAAHLSTDELHETEDALISRGAPLTYDINEANLILGNISRAKRAKLELQWKGVLVEDSAEDQSLKSSKRTSKSAKRRKLSMDESYERSRLNAPKPLAEPTESETEDDSATRANALSPVTSRQDAIGTSASESSLSDCHGSPLDADVVSEPQKDRLFVVKYEWLHDSILRGKLADLRPYLVVNGKLLHSSKIMSQPPDSSEESNAKSKLKTVNVTSKNFSAATGIVDRAHEDSERLLDKQKKIKRRKNVFRPIRSDKTFLSSSQSAAGSSSPFHARPPTLLRQTTSEYDEAKTEKHFPSPEWVQEGKIYACERATPLNPPNKDFIAELKKIKMARTLILDEIGVRAYSTSIAAIAAYPHIFQSSSEVLALPGCDQKIAHLFHEYKTTGQLQAVRDLDADPALCVLREFYDIWGVGAKTAREFYYDKGWRDLDDIVENGWNSLSRSQQIGLKFYDEFQIKIPQQEVEAIASIIKRHAKLVTDSNVEVILVGGYRRGKPESGDVDIILSHQNEEMTYNLVDRIVTSIEKEGWITHTLIMNLTSSKRNQEPLPINNATLVGHGFDTLDKALVVWQNPDWPTQDADIAANPKAKNPNPHRRVDIIISPWRTVGCAVAGWTSGTTFQRDLRRYAKYRKGWKFDSSGVREQGTGRWVDLEGWTDKRTRCTDWRVAERKVFEGMGLVYREPWDRCTG